MTTTDIIGADMKTTLRRLKLGRMLDTLPERMLLARQQKMPHQDFLLLVLSEEATRRDSLAVALRVQRARFDPAMQLDAWDATAKVTFDRALLNELTDAPVSRRPRARRHRRPRRRRQNVSRPRPRPHRVSTRSERAGGPHRPHAEDAEARAAR
jgi:hypothetical protein